MMGTWAKFIFSVNLVFKAALINVAQLVRLYPRHLMKYRNIRRAIRGDGQYLDCHITLSQLPPSM